MSRRAMSLCAVVMLALAAAVTIVLVPGSARVDARQGIDLRAREAITTYQTRAGFVARIASCQDYKLVQVDTGAGFEQVDPGALVPDVRGVCTLELELDSAPVMTPRLTLHRLDDTVEQYEESFEVERTSPTLPTCVKFHAHERQALTVHESEPLAWMWKLMPGG